MTTPRCTFTPSEPDRSAGWLARVPAYHGETYEDTALFEHEFRRLYEARFAGLFRYLDRTCGDADLASDLAQEAFVRLYRRGGMPDQPAAWLVAVASNLLRDQGRQAGRRARLLEGCSEDVVQSPSADPETEVLAVEKRQRVREALDRLAPRDREILLLRHSGYSYREIAAATNIGETSVGATLLRAGAAFKRAFEEIHGAPD